MGTKIIPWCTNWVTAVNLSKNHWIHQYFVVEHNIAIYFYFYSMYIVVSRLKKLDNVLNDAVLIENIWNHEKRTSTLTQHQRLVVLIVRCRSRWHIRDTHAQFYEFPTYGHIKPWNLNRWHENEDVVWYNFCRGDLLPLHTFVFLEFSPSSKFLKAHHLLLIFIFTKTQTIVSWALRFHARNSNP